MATKNHPGEFDCYANAEPDEPMFILLARDERAPHVVREWVKKRGQYDEKAADALNLAEQMEAYRAKRNAQRAQEAQVSSINRDFLWRGVCALWKQFVNEAPPQHPRADSDEEADVFALRVFWLIQNERIKQGVDLSLRNRLVMGVEAILRSLPARPSIESNEDYARRVCALVRAEEQNALDGASAERQGASIFSICSMKQHLDPQCARDDADPVTSTKASARSAAGKAD